MSGFLDKLARELVDKHHDLSRLLIILPARRSAVFLREAISARLSTPGLAPRLLTIEDFFLECLGWEAESKQVLLFQLYESYLEMDLPELEDFADFFKWGKQLINDFNEVDRYLADAKQLFAYLADVKRIQQWELTPGESIDTEMVNNYLRFWENLYPLYARYAQKLKENKRVYQGLAFRQMATEIAGITPALQQEYEQLIFAGFSALNKAEEKVLLHLYESGKATFYWDLDRYYFDDLQHEAGKFLRASPLIRKLRERQALNWLGDSLSTQAKNIRIINAAGDNLQMMAAQEEALHYKEAQHPDVAIVLADEHSLPTFLNHLSGPLGELNITMGLPLSETAAAGFFQSLWDMQSSLKTNAGGKLLIHHKLWDNFLSQPLLVPLLHPLNPEELRQNIRLENRVFATVNDIFPAEPDKYLGPFLETRMPPSRFCAAAASLCESFKDNFSANAVETGILYTFYKIFRQLENLFNTYDYIRDLKTAQQFYQEIVREQNLDLQGEPLQGMQIMGMLETRTLSFKNIILCSVNENILPQGRSFSGLIPFDIKMQFGLPTYLDKDSVYAYHFYRLLQEAENISLIFNSAAGGMGSSEASRFIHQLEYELPLKNPNTHFEKLTYSGVLRLADKAEEIPKTPAVMARLTEMAEKGISPTALQEYTRDPLQFYYSKVLGVREVDEVEEVAGFHTQGTVVHELLQSFFSNGEEIDKGPVGLLQSDLPALQRPEADIRSLVEKGLREKGLKQLEEGKNLLVRETLTAMLRNYLEKCREELREEREDREILALEITLEAMVTLHDGRRVRIRGNADRIDRVGKVIEILDYKTGKAEDTEVKINSTEDLWDPKKNKALQLLIYAWLYYKNTPDCREIKAGIISLRNVWASPFFCQWNKKDVLSPAQLDDFEEFLKLLLKDIFDQELNFSEKILTLEDDD